MAEILDRAQFGPIRAVIEAHGSALRLFKQREQNAIVRAAMKAAGDLWIEIFLPKRFNDDYAWKVLGYSNASAWDQSKQRLINRGVLTGPKSTIFVFTGQMRANALSQASTDARSTRTKATATIRVPIGHPLTATTARYFKFLPQVELRRLTVEIERVMLAAIQYRLAVRVIQRANAPAPSSRAIPHHRKRQRQAGTERRRAA